MACRRHHGAPFRLPFAALPSADLGDLGTKSGAEFTKI
jgi:hypothetical protein